ncbi:MAG: helix-turn-helix domain-containing protein [Gemmatales bacterium]
MEASGRRKRQAETAMTISVKSVCELAGISVPTLYRLISQGEAPKGFHLGRSHKWLKDDVVSWLKSLGK